MSSINDLLEQSRAARAELRTRQQGPFGHLAHCMETAELWARWLDYALAATPLESHGSHAHDALRRELQNWVDYASEQLFKSLAATDSPAR